MNYELSKLHQLEIPIRVYGFDNRFFVDINDAVIDTGFTGFLSLPLVYALRASLVLFSTNRFVLADGSTNDALVCLGTVAIQEKQIAGLISILPGQSVLLGMEFLNKFSCFGINFTNKTFSLD